MPRSYKYIPPCSCSLLYNNSDRSQTQKLNEAVLSLNSWEVVHEIVIVTLDLGRNLDARVRVVMERKQ